MGFDAGALFFKIQAVGAALFKQDMRESKTAIDGVEQASTKAKGSADALGDATDKTSEKARRSKQPLNEQAKATEEVGEQSRKAKPKQDEQTHSTEEQAQAAKKLSVALIATGVAVAAVVALSVAKYAEFDQAMSQTAAATMATRQEQEDLSDAALEAGADTAYSASEAAAAQEELAKAGQSVADIVGGSLNGALALAAAGQLEVARSAEIMATTLTQFRLPAEDAARVSDVLAAGAGKAQGSVEDMGLAMSYVGPLAASFGWSIEETAGTIAYFSSQGIIGEKAGTALRGVLAALQAPSAAAAGVMAQYGIEVYDAQGKMLSAAGIAEQFRLRLGGLTDQERQAALGRIFGNESLLGATLLYEGGAQAVTQWTDAVDDSGYAAEQAAMRQDNLAGDIEKLGGAMDTALIRTGSGANDILRAQVQLVTQLVDWYGELPAPIQGTALVLGVGVAAMALFAGGALGLRAKLGELKEAFDRTNTSMGRTAFIGAGVGLALTGIVAVLSAWAQAQVEAEARAQSFRDTLDQTTGTITKSTREIAVAALQADQSVNILFGSISRGNAADAAERLGISLETVTDAILGNAEAYDELSPYLRAAEGDTAALEDVERSTGLSRVDALNQLSLLADGYRLQSTALGEAQRQQEQANSATEEGVAVTQDATEAYMTAATEVKDFESELRGLIDTVLEANEVGQDAISANIDYQNALAKVDETIRLAQEGQEGYSLTLDETTQAGRDNLDLLNALASQSQDAANKQFSLDRNTESYRANLEAGRQALIDRAQQLGYNAEQAGALADQIYRIPSETEWALIASTTAARAELDGFFTSYNGRRINVTVDANGGQTYQIAGTNVRFNADGAVYPRVQFFGDGGRRENHVAQIARGGDVRVWAEPETDGETYLPHALSKRARSEQLMQETATIFGGRYITAADVEAGALGSRSAVSGSGASLIGQLVVQGQPGMNEDQLARKAAKVAVEYIEARLK